MAWPDLFELVNPDCYARWPTGIANLVCSFSGRSKSGAPRARLLDPAVHAVPTPLMAGVGQDDRYTGADPMTRDFPGYPAGVGDCRVATTTRR